MATWMRATGWTYHLAGEAALDGYVYRTACGRNWKRAKPVLSGLTPDNILRCPECMEAASVSEPELPASQPSDASEPAANAIMPSSAALAAGILAERESEPTVYLTPADMAWLAAHAEAFLAAGESRFGSSARFQAALERHNLAQSVPF